MLETSGLRFPQETSFFPLLAAYSAPSARPSQEVYTLGQQHHPSRSLHPSLAILDSRDRRGSRRERRGRGERREEEDPLQTPTPLPPLPSLTAFVE